MGSRTSAGGGLREVGGDRRRTARRARRRFLHLGIGPPPRLRYSCDAGSGSAHGGHDDAGRCGRTDAGRGRAADRGRGRRRRADLRRRSARSRSRSRRPGSIRSGCSTTCCSGSMARTSGIHECWTILSAIAEATTPGRARDDRHVHGVPQPRAAGQDGGHARPRQRRPADPRRRGRLARARSSRRSATRPTTGSGGSRRRWRSSPGSIREGRADLDGRGSRRATPSCCRPPGPTCRSSSRPRVRGCSS